MAEDAVAFKEPKTLVCGLIMPISQIDNLPAAHWDEVREIIIKTVEGIGSPRFSARLVSEGDDAGVIHKRIIQNVYTDDIAICDVSGRNPNVMFELGMRLAFDKPTVIIKDDQTARIFDTDVIEYLTYRRDLRYASMEQFRTKLAQKTVATYELSLSDHDKQSFLKSFGTFKVVKLDESSETPDKAMLSMMAQMQRQISRLSNSLPSRRRPATSSPSELDDEIEQLINSPRFPEARLFVRQSKAENPDLNSDNCMEYPELVGQAVSRFPEIVTSPNALRRLVDVSL
ncbi:hypothetical protein [Rhodopseudomonas palustris]|uniref:hypothetical protein n=1 Tax=Rhodopseudomonas palustris TaxID=1076 RepID=UPI000AF86BA7|nr:hypothetical protein [Rhodopseudomonas palustris]